MVAGPAKERPERGSAPGRDDARGGCFGSRIDVGHLVPPASTARAGAYAVHSLHLAHLYGARP